MSEAKKTITIPHIPGEDKVVECCLNGKNYLIQRGEKVQVSAAMLELLQNSHILGEGK